MPFVMQGGIARRGEAAKSDLEDLRKRLSYVPKKAPKPIPMALPRMHDAELENALARAFASSRTIGLTTDYGKGVAGGAMNALSSLFGGNSKEKRFEKSMEYVGELIEKIKENKALPPETRIRMVRTLNESNSKNLAGNLDSLVRELGQRQIIREEKFPV